MQTKKESKEVDKNEDNGNIESLRQSLNNFYINIIKDVQRVQNKNKFPIIRENECSRDNLLCYLALREHDLSDLQLQLAEQGLSSLGRLESQVMVSIEKVIRNLGLPLQEINSLCRSTFAYARSSLAKRSQLLLGRSREKRKTRIMVTLDSTNTHQPELLEQLLRSGMDIYS